MKSSLFFIILCILFCISASSFVKNVGQVAPHVQYYCDMAGYRLLVTRSYLCLQKVRPDTEGAANKKRTVSISYVYIDLPEQALIEPMQKSTTYVNIFKGRDPSHWHSHIPVYTGVRVHHFAPGVTLELRRQGWCFICRDRHMEATISPRGQLGLQETDGSIRLHTQAGDIVLQNPTLQSTHSRPSEVTIAGNTIHLEAREGPLGQTGRPSHEITAARGRQQRLYSTYIGSQGNDNSKDFIIDSTGAIVFLGQSDVLSLPACDGSTCYVTGCKSEDDCWMGKLSADLSTLLWQTYISGSQEEYAFKLALGDSDSSVVACHTKSNDLPVTQGYDLTYNGSIDIYLFSLNAAGDTLLFTTYFGSSGSDQYPYGLDLAANNDILFYFSTYSVDIPAPNGFCQTNQGGRDNYIGRLSADGMELLAGAYLGSSSAFDIAKELVIDSAGDVIVAATGEPGLPLVNNYTGYHGGTDGYFAKITAYLDTIKWSTYYGGSDLESLGHLALDADDNILFGGISRSADIELVNPICVYREPFLNIAFIGKFAADGQQLMWSTFLLTRGTHGDYSKLYALTCEGDDVYAAMHSAFGPFHTPNAYKDFTRREEGMPWPRHFCKISQQENEITWGSYFYRVNPLRPHEDCGLTISQLRVTHDGEVVIFGDTAIGGYDDHFSYIPTDENSYMPRPPSQDMFHRSCYLAVLTNPVERAMIKQPQLLLPSNQAVGQSTQVQFSWQKTEPFLQETGYMFRIAEMAGNYFYPYTYYQLPAGTCSFTLAVKNGKTYKWSVKALGSGVYPHESYWANACAGYTFQTEFIKKACYRLYNSATTDHLYTLSEMERDYLINHSNYRYEGIAFYAYDSYEWPDDYPVVRYYNQYTGIHTYMIFPERPYPLDEWLNEWCEFHAFGEQVANTVPVYRFQDFKSGGYLFTTSTIERDYILNNMPNYEYQGIVFYVYPSP